MIKSDSKIFVAGHNGMVGSSIMRLLRSEGFKNLLTSSHEDLDLINQSAVSSFFEEEQPEFVFLAAAKVGGILANNNYPADFLYQNLMIQTNVINAAFEYGVKRLIFLGSSCIYPKITGQPIKENQLLTGILESTNEPYAIAKIAGIKLCESYNRQYHETHDVDFRCLMPTNLYGPGDNYHPKNSHVIPGLINRFIESIESNKNSISIWGTGLPRREFLYVDDLARASLYVMNLSKSDYLNMVDGPMCSHVNVGVGKDLTIKDLAFLIAEITGFEGKILFDHSKPDGTMEKLLDSSKLINSGWKPLVTMQEGIKLAIEDFLVQRP